ncbi:DUF308 domain-containing protein [Paenibacillus sp. UMB4589-SE434]|uniref:YqeB family protein n=1 Tax=Paenibacillus sp. UMB4589-SE434 TaxID=3046314 RepID=UPI00254D3B70|nr:DUF308 domain-containing protein [Paenibacillus sp. UMB4589-SE434]MDK8182417.1 DUF308 domain-containing protein [Paenibacillus sp. UMB4589-SE434]
MNVHSHRTTLGFSYLDKLLIWIVPPILGLTLGWFLPSVAKWAITLPWVPLKGPLELIASYTGPWVIVVTSCIGLIAGLWLTYAAFNESLVIYISDHTICMAINGKEEVFAKEQVSTGFLDGKQLVLIGTRGQELYREKHETTALKVADAFIQHGYDWSQADPFSDQYKRWVPDSPGLPLGANALLKAREVALQRKEQENIKDLHQELTKLGITVRDKDNRQYWREHKLQ